MVRTTPAGAGARECPREAPAGRRPADPAVRTAAAGSGRKSDVPLGRSPRSGQETQGPAVGRRSGRADLWWPWARRALYAEPLISDVPRAVVSDVCEAVLSDVGP